MQQTAMAAPYQPAAAGPSRPHRANNPYGAPVAYGQPRTDRADPPAAQANWGNHAGYNTNAGVGRPMPTPRGGEVRRDASLSEDSAAKRNPLSDLMETEKLYVEQLTLVIRRVAAAWSRKDLPPPKLDAMFRCVEAVYRANRAFGVRLKDVGANPSSPKALGDLLMRWIDDLEPSYGRYTTIYLTGFDSYQLVTKNPLLPEILDDMSAVSPPTPPLQRWTLDALFLLPYTRLRYYRKLYSRLLQSTTEGRSDHRLLATASQRLETLVADVEARLEFDVSEEDTPASSIAPSSQSRENSWANEKGRASRTSSQHDSSVETQSVLSSFNSRMDSTRNSATSAGTSVTHSPGRGPKVAAPALNTAPPLSDLELRIDPDRAIDLFSMQPRKCKLHMNPPNLAYTRSLRTSHDVTVYFTPTTTGQQVVHRRAHLFVLTDLFLITDRMEASEKAAKAQQVAREQPGRVGEGGPMPEMWLAYPPLAGKHLAVVEGQQSNVLAVTVMRKETFVIHAESEMDRDQILKSVQDCIAFATGASQRSALSPTVVSPQEGRSPVANLPPARYPSPLSAAVSPRVESYESMPNNLSVPMGNMSLDPNDQPVQWSSNGSPGNAHPPRGASLRSRQAAQQAQAGRHPQDGHPPRAQLTQLQQTAQQLRAMSPNSPLSPSGQHGFPMASQSDPSLVPRSTSVRSGQSSQSTQSTHSMPGNMNMGYPVPRQQAQYNQFSRMPVRDDLPPVPPIRHGGGHLSDSGHPSDNYNPYPPPRSRSAEPYGAAQEPQEVIESPSARFGAIKAQTNGNSPLSATPGDDEDMSPPGSPTQEEATTLTGPAVISAQMKCKVFLQQGHGQWKSLGHAKLKLYVEKARNVKQLVVEADKGKSVLISTIVLTDGVERVAKTGVAVEVSDRGQRTGIIYMIQLRNETSAGGLHEQLLAGSGRLR